MKFQLVSAPLTWCHKVGIVAGYSNSDMVNPILTRDILGDFWWTVLREPTIDFLLILHQQKWVVVYVAENFNIRSRKHNQYMRPTQQTMLTPPSSNICISGGVLVCKRTTRSQTRLMKYSHHKYPWVKPTHISITVSVERCQDPQNDRKCLTHGTLPKSYGVLDDMLP